MDGLSIVLVAIYRYQNFPVRLMYSLLERIEGIKPYVIFFKNFEANMGKSPTPEEEKLFVKKMVELRPRLVGISVLSPYVPVAKRLTKLIKDNTSALVVWGGVHPTISPENCIKEADMICVGEGEGTMKELAECLRDGKDYRHIHNLWINDGGRVIRNPMRPLIQDLDSLSLLSYGSKAFFFIDSGSITGDDPRTRDYYLWVQTSRGCPYICSYCVNSLLRPSFKALGPYSRRRSVESVMNEIKRHLSGTMGHIYFVDETFGDDKQWLDEFVSRYKKEAGLPFNVEYHPNMVNDEMVGKLVEAGVYGIKIGIQSGSDRIRNSIFHRPGKNADIIALANKISGYGVNIVYDLILDNPYETEESLKDTIDLLLRLPKPLTFDLYSLQYFPGYPLTQKAIKDGYLKAGDLTAERLMKTNLRNWAFIPRLLPCTKKQALQNIIWLVAWGHVSERLVRYGVFGDSLGAKACVAYMNLKSIVAGKILEASWRHRAVHYLIRGFHYISRGNIKTAYKKTVKALKKR